jgi:hypothetical protein
MEAFGTPQRLLLKSAKAWQVAAVRNVQTVTLGPSALGTDDAVTPT